MGEKERVAQRVRSIDRAIDSVLAALHESWPLDRLAASAGYAPHHFHRSFREATGETPAAFVARARAERAASLLAGDPSVSLTSVAGSVGFPTQAQLSRAFRQRFGLPPSAWDRVSPLHDRASHPVLAKYPLRDDPREARRSDVRVQSVQGFDFAYVRVRDPYGSSGIVEAWEQLVAAFPDARLIGMSWDDPDVVPAELCRYDLGVPLSPESPANAATFSHRWVPSFRAGVLRCEGGMESVDAAWQTITRSWLPQSDHRRAQLPAMELFRADPRESGWQDWDLDCVVPIV